jgi:hypothetical protein
MSLRDFRVSAIRLWWRLPEGKAKVVTKDELQEVKIEGVEVIYLRHSLKLEKRPLLLIFHAQETPPLIAIARFWKWSLNRHSLKFSPGPIDTHHTTYRCRCIFHTNEHTHMYTYTAAPALAEYKGYGTFSGMYCSRIECHALLSRRSHSSRAGAHRALAPVLVPSHPTRVNSSMQIDPRKHEPLAVRAAPLVQ